MTDYPENTVLQAVANLRCGDMAPEDWWVALSPDEIAHIMKSTALERRTVAAETRAQERDPFPGKVGGIRNSRGWDCCPKHQRGDFRGPPFGWRGHCDICLQAWIPRYKEALTNDLMADFLPSQVAFLVKTLVEDRLIGVDPAYEWRGRR